VLWLFAVSYIVIHYEADFLFNNFEPIVKLCVEHCSPQRPISVLAQLQVEIKHQYGNRFITRSLFSAISMDTQIKSCCKYYINTSAFLVPSCMVQALLF
jgi:hypothetical protein